MACAWVNDAPGPVETLEVRRVEQFGPSEVDPERPPALASMFHAWLHEESSSSVMQVDRVVRIRVETGIAARHRAPPMRSASARERARRTTAGVVPDAPSTVGCPNGPERLPGARACSARTAGSSCCCLEATAVGLSRRACGRSRRASDTGARFQKWIEMMMPRHCSSCRTALACRAGGNDADHDSPEQRRLIRSAPQPILHADRFGARLAPRT